MKSSTLFAAALSAACMHAYATDSKCEGSYYNAKAPIITNQKLAQSTKELCFSEFAVMHSGVSRTPLWSAEKLTDARVREARSMERKDAFHPESRLPHQERAELKDYARTGLARDQKFDRGHMAPNGDMSNETAQFESFSLANIIPQNPDNNRHLWSGIESAVRKLAERRGEIYVITGPLFTGGSLIQLDGRVLVPPRIFKLVYDPRSAKGAAYVVNNAEGNNYSVFSIAELEKMAGINFFPGMPDKVKTTKLSLPAPNEKHYGDRYTTEKSSMQLVSKALKSLMR